MEHESFEDEQVADLMNQHFVSIKVDREERPDIDSIYMSVCQAMTGSGGWPLTVLMTAEQKPFFAGTYFPKHNRYGHIGMMDLLANVAERWKEDQITLADFADEIAKTMAKQNESNRSTHVQADKKPVKRAAQLLASGFDQRYGGFGHAPKFPMPHNLMFLLRYYMHEGNQNVLDMVVATLQHMYRGGIFDHIGFGFSRYSTDEQWLTPHFEKMLYDNALMVITLLECYQASQNERYKMIAQRTLCYIEREMTAPEGGFYSAQDADSEGVEGKYYTFTPRQVMEVLGIDAGTHFCQRYDITPKGNFEGVSIPNLIQSHEIDDPDPSWQHMRDQLYEYRLSRTRLHKDDKVLTSWNGLMIVAYAKAYRAIGSEPYLASAKKAYDFLCAHLYDSDGLRTSWRTGKATVSGLLDDYAYMIWGCLALYEATFDVQYLARAVALTQEAIQRFSDHQGGYYLNASDGDKLIFRPKETYDGALPSGNAVLAYCLCRLAAYTGEQKWMVESDKQIGYLMPEMSESPLGHTFALMALMEKVYPTKQLVCVLRQKTDRQAIVFEIGQRFLPHLTVLVKADEEDELESICPFLHDYIVPEDWDNAYYLCENQSCSAPVSRLEDIIEKLLVNE